MATERLTTPEKLIDRPAKEVVREIAKLNPDIRQMTFCRYYPWNKEEVDLFWYFSPDELINGNKLDWLASDDLQDRESLVGVVSLVEVGGGLERLPDGSGIYHFPKKLHIPMLDFSLPRGTLPEHIRPLRRFLKEILKERQGWILSSGSDFNSVSYHYYGSRLLDKVAWDRFMKKARLEDARSGLIDEAYIGRALLPKIVREQGFVVQETGLAPGYATLRLGRNQLRPQIPVVVDTL